MSKDIQTLAAIANILGLAVAVLALMRDTLDFTIPGFSGQNNLSPSTVQSSCISKTGVAIVFDPPSNIRKSPNGESLCSVR
jgi:hypothetical protein